MTDESFHLTPLDIRRFDFGSALRGYDKARVDQFRDEVAREVERLVKQAQDLDAKAKGFHEQLRAFRERDKAINEALVSAQQLRAEVREQADREAQLILREARAEADKMLEQARSEVRRVQGDLEQLVRQRRSYLAQLRTMIERQLADVEAAEAAPSSMTPPAPEPAGKPATPEWLNSLASE
ncbi:MAG: DivIVA domain-containing protein [Gemmatimonadaceae bacterium]